MTTAPRARPLTADEREFCVRLGLEIGVDDDDLSKHQFRHVCWPYSAYEGPLCGSPRLWLQGRLSSDAGVREDVDCEGCLAQLDRLRAADPTLLAVVGRLAEAVHTLTDVAEAARGRLDALTRDPEYVTAVVAGYPETRPELLREVLEADAARHVKYATEYASRREARQ